MAWSVRVKGNVCLCAQNFRKWEWLEIVFEITSSIYFNQFQCSTWNTGIFPDCGKLYFHINNQTHYLFLNHSTQFCIFIKIIYFYLILSVNTRENLVMAENALFSNFIIDILLLTTSLIPPSQPDILYIKLQYN